MYWACQENEPRAVNISMFDIPKEAKILIPPVKYNHLISASYSFRPSVNHESLKRYSEWTEKYGMKGAANKHEVSNDVEKILKSKLPGMMFGLNNP